MISYFQTLLNYQSLSRLQTPDQVMFPYSDQIQRGSFPTLPFATLPNGDFLGGESDPGTGRPQGGRAKRGGSTTKNIVPVEIAQLNNYREDNGPLMIHGIEVFILLYQSQV